MTKNVLIKKTPVLYRSLCMDVKKWNLDHSTPWTLGPSTPSIFFFVSFVFFVVSSNEHVCLIENTRKSGGIPHGRLATRLACRLPTGSALHTRVYRSPTRLDGFRVSCVTNPDSRQ